MAKVLPYNPDPKRVRVPKKRTLGDTVAGLFAALFAALALAIAILAPLALVVWLITTIHGMVA